MNNIAVYPGSFDPFTNGHLAIVKSASLIFEKVFVLVAINPDKQHMFSLKDRTEIVQQSINECKSISNNVEVIEFNGIVADFCIHVNANILVLGIRTVKDLEQEYSNEHFTRLASKNVQTLYLSPEAKNFSLSSTLIRNLINAGRPSATEGLVSSFLHKSLINNRFSF